MNFKFKSSISAIYFASVVIFNLIILLLLTSRIFVLTNIGWIFGLFLLAIDAALIIPMMFLTGYEFKETYLLVKDWPIKRYKIPYENIIDVLDSEDVDMKALKNKHIVALSMNRVVIKYYEKQKDGTKQETYMFVSPQEMKLFLIKISGKLKQAEEENKKKIIELSEAQKEHEEKKKQWQKKKAELKAQNQPEVIKVNGVQKFKGFKKK